MLGGYSVWRVKNQQFRVRFFWPRLKLTSFLLKLAQESYPGENVLLNPKPKSELWKNIFENMVWIYIYIYIYIYMLKFWFLKKMKINSNSISLSILLLCTQVEVIYQSNTRLVTFVILTERFVRTSVVLLLFDFLNNWWFQFFWNFQNQRNHQIQFFEKKKKKNQNQRTHGFQLFQKHQRTGSIHERMGQRTSG